MISCMYACMYVYVYIYIHTHASMKTMCATSAGSPASSAALPAAHSSCQVLSSPQGTPHQTGLLDAGRELQFSQMPRAPRRTYFQSCSETRDVYVCNFPTRTSLADGN